MFRNHGLVSCPHPARPDGSELDRLCVMSYNSGMTHPVKKLLSLRIDPDAWHRARIASVTAGKALGDWLAEAIAEKIERDSETERSPSS